MYHFTDAHAHLSSLSEEAIVHCLDHAQQCNVQTIINVCSDLPSLLKAKNFHQKGLFHIGATAPHAIEKNGESEWPFFEEAARTGFLKAIGETGLDYHYHQSSAPMQKKFLSRYLSLAVSLDLPLVLHCREAFFDLFSVFDKAHKGSVMIHCFTGTLEEARQALDRGWLISISGIVTFSKSSSLRETVQYIPLDSLLIETDSPYLAPEPYRGKMNEPAFVVEVAKTVAALKQRSLEEIAKITTDNAIRFFKL
ncbi:MAG: YchF/TatD family DNA exonuclease [Parachlamydiales bacterium]|nr:YchF/TatD family DNA exonuclease [Parachlamydiales bacterium]